MNGAKQKLITKTKVHFSVLHFKLSALYIHISERITKDNLSNVDVIISKMGGQIK